MSHNYERETHYKPQIISRDFWQRWRCVRCGKEGRIRITFRQSRDGVEILKRLERSHRHHSPLCRIGYVDKQRDVGNGIWQAGDLVVLDKNDHLAWVYEAGERLEVEGDDLGELLIP